MENINELNPGVFAFVGDAVYALLVRTELASINRRSKELHSLSVEYVNASSQARAFEKISPLLTEKEQDIFRRGRNFHTNNSPKNSTQADYHTATGLECLFGYLHLTGQSERIKELFDIIVK